MLDFEPPILLQQLADALDVLEGVVVIPEIPRVNDPEFDRSEPKTVVTESTEYYAYLPCSDDGMDVSVSTIIRWAEMLKEFRLKERTSLRMTTTTLFYIAGNDFKEHHVAYDIKEKTLQLTTSIDIAGEQFRAQIVTGFTPFALFIEKEGNNDKHGMPSYEATTTYLEVEHPRKASEAIVEDVARAFLFEVAATLDWYFVIRPYPYVVDAEPGEEVTYHDISLRELKVGKGLRDVQSLYVEGCSAQPEEYALIHFAKVLEYVSATVVKLTKHESLRRRLRTKAALDPDAKFLDGIIALAEEQRRYGTDAEALRLTLQTACDPTAFAGAAPLFLKKVRSLGFTDDAKARTAALDEFAACLSSTRNELSHAKANYELTGLECPESELPELVVCARVAAEQAIRWYAGLPETSRVAPDEIDPAEGDKGKGAK